LLGVGILIGFVYYVGIGSLIVVLLSVNPAVILVMVGIELLGFFFYATAWYILIRATGHKMRFLTCQGVTFASIFASLTMPSGIFLEAVRVLLGAKESGMNMGESTATVILHRILYIVGFVASTVLALVALTLERRIGASLSFEIAVIPLGATLGLAILFALSLNPKLLQPLMDRALRILQPIIRLVAKNNEVDFKSDRFLTDYHKGFRNLLSSGGRVAESFTASLGDWGCSVVILWIVLISLGATISFWAVVVTMAFGKMIQLTPIAIPGMLGVYETAITTSLSFFGTPVAVAASAALLSRIVTYWLDLPVTGVAAYHYGFKLFGEKRFQLK
jgi:uncharacterized protein (TIRG00374 family)